MGARNKVLLTSGRRGATIEGLGRQFLRIKRRVSYIFAVNRAKIFSLFSLIFAFFRSGK